VELLAGRYSPGERVARVDFTSEALCDVEVAAGVELFERDRVELRAPARESSIWDSGDFGFGFFDEPLFFETRFFGFFTSFLRTTTMPMLLWVMKRGLGQPTTLTARLKSHLFSPP
jgi:hypothetical protein